MSAALDVAAFGAVGERTLALRHAVEEFLYHDADLLDRWRLAEWLALFTDECSYLVPSTDRPEGDPFTDLYLIQDDRFLLEQRVDSLLTKTAWAESPHSRTRRLVTNVVATHLGEGAVEVRANFLITRSRKATVDTYPGHYEMLLEADPGGEAGFRIRMRKAVLALEELRPHGRVSIIL
ncbi:MAG: aromatic-ring-hydroxylating dioxygenase subunit beta [Acidimicrobiia bacterium]|nr:aromatic-ring-hydroxylating dioxygenase subunit beta [Acidimicrobiia bacterium]